jgi:hypothetical protein
VARVWHDARQNDDVRAYVGVTDWDWYRFLQVRHATEVNFWQPSGGHRFRAIPGGAPFFFKSHYSHGNRIVGGGFLSGWASLPISRAWEFFGEDNGCATIEEMRTRIRKYRRKPLDGADSDPEIGCIMRSEMSSFLTQRRRLTLRQGGQATSCGAAEDAHAGFAKAVRHSWGVSPTTRQPGGSLQQNRYVRRLALPPGCRVVALGEVEEMPHPAQPGPAEQCSWPAISETCPPGEGMVP